MASERWRRGRRVRRRSRRNREARRRGDESEEEAQASLHLPQELTWQTLPSSPSARGQRGGGAVRSPSGCVPGEALGMALPVAEAARAACRRRGRA
eukprot:scaffold246455_cov28-Tisochrysis_lutea.AAC.1